MKFSAKNVSTLSPDTAPCSRRSDGRARCCAVARVVRLTGRPRCQRTGIIVVVVIVEIARARESGRRPMKIDGDVRGSGTF